MNKLSKILLALVLAISIVSAVGPGDVSALFNTNTSGIGGAISGLCTGLKTLLPVAAMLMLIFAGVIYAAGQLMGAETRARSNVWATAALTGALICILIVVVAPAVLNVIYGSSGTTLSC